MSLLFRKHPAHRAKLCHNSGHKRGAIQGRSKSDGTQNERGMSEELARLLAQNTIFQHLTAGQRSQAAAAAQRRRFPAGSFITHDGDVWPYLFIVGVGSVDGMKESADGRQLIVLTLVRSELFWGLAFFNDGMKTPVALVARETTEIHVWPRDALLPLLLDTPQALWSLSQRMVVRMAQASQILEGLAFQPVSGRLARFLLDRFSDAGEASLERSLTLDDIAAHIGSTREMVCRALYQFSDKDFIRITRTEFTLIDEAGLADIAARG